MLDVVAVDVACRTGEVQVCRQPARRFLNVGGLVAGAHGLGVDCLGIVDIWQDVLAYVCRGRKRKDRAVACGLARLSRVILVTRSGTKVQPRE